MAERTLKAIALLCVCGSVALLGQGAPLIPEVQTLYASDGVQDGRFGVCVATHGNLLIVGAPGDDDFGMLSGAAYVFARSPSNEWIQETKIVRTPGQPLDAFGNSVAIHGDVALIAWPLAFQIGAVQVYLRVAPDTWTNVTALIGSQAEPQDAFGGPIVFDGHLAAVGAANDDVGGEFSGSVYVFRMLDQATWVEEARLVASDAAPDRFFGRELSLNGDRLIIGAPGFPDLSTVPGAAYVFRRLATGDWVEEGILTLPGIGPDDKFGSSVAICGDRAIVGAEFRTQPGAPDGGAAYVFRWDGAEWGFETELFPPTQTPSDFFGSAVRLRANHALVSAENSSPEYGFGVGSVHVFRRTGSAWSHVATCVESSPGLADFMGADLAWHGGRVFAGAPYREDPEGVASGGVFAYELSALLCAHDVNADGVVDTADLGLILQNFGSSCDCAAEDINADGVIDTADLGLLIGAFGSACP
jgi:hypothetical protein